eukprot:9492016-Pyramimonas_sp.AAC.1
MVPPVSLSPANGAPHKIVVLSLGKVVEEGSPHELLQKEWREQRDSDSAEPKDSRWGACWPGNPNSNVFRKCK